MKVSLCPIPELELIRIWPPPHLFGNETTEFLVAKQQGVHATAGTAILGS